MDFLSGFWPALISKGLRPLSGMTKWPTPFLACPDFKGIKTQALRHAAQFPMFLACPDFKGIKTQTHELVPVNFTGFWPALISKGLRHIFQFFRVTGLGFWPALISKGLRLVQGVVVLSADSVSGLP